MNCKACLILLSLIASSLIALSMLPGCGDDGGGAVVTTPPSITQTSPQDGAVDRNLNPLIQVWFDQELDETTVDSASFYVEGAESYRVEYVNALKVINLYLKEILEPESTYTVVVNTDIENTRGDGMLSDFNFSFTTGTLDQAHLVDYMEPNNDMDSAMELDLNKTYTVLASCGGSEDEVDFFKFTLTDTAKVTLKVEQSYSELDEPGWFVSFRVCGGAFYHSLFARLFNDGPVNLRYSFLPGTYCVETGNTEGTVNLTTYNLTLETSAPCPDDEYEDNDFEWEAKDLDEGTYSLYACDNDTDYFRVALEAGQTLRARISQVPPGNDERRLRITDSDNELLRQSTGTGDPMTVTWTAGETGDYHIVVFWYDDTAYQLEVEILD